MALTGHRKVAKNIGAALATASTSALGRTTVESTSPSLRIPYSDRT